MTQVPRKSLPYADVLMALILVGIMLSLDLAAAVVGGVERPIPWFVYLVMPGTLGLIWGSYALSMAAVCRLAASPSRHVDIASSFMGKTLVIAGITIALAHAGLLAGYAGLIKGKELDAMLRLVFVGLGLNLAYVYNLMPKIAGRAMGQGPDLRLVGRTGTLCSLGMVVVGAAAPIDGITRWYMGLAMISPALVLVSTAAWWLQRRAG